MLELVGWIGAVCLGVCAVPQTIKTVKQGHARGISLSFLLLWIVGEMLTFVYVLPKKDLPLLVNYGLNLICLSVILRYRMQPRVNPGREKKSVKPV